MIPSRQQSTGVKEEKQIQRGVSNVDSDLFFPITRAVRAIIALSYLSHTL